MSLRIAALAGLGSPILVDAPEVWVVVLSPTGGAQLRVRALIDTGADITCVADEAMASLGYRATRTVGVVSASGRDERNLYVAEMRFPESVPVHRARLEVAGLPGLGQEGRPDMLLGRDVLEQGAFCWDGRSGRTTLRFGG